MENHVDKGISTITTCYSCWAQVIVEPVANHWVTGGVIATNMYGDLCPGSWHVGMVLRNLSAQEVHIPPKTIIGNVQTAKRALIGRSLDT